MTKTAIIIGAGASADFNLPLGDELYQKAAKTLEDFERRWKLITEKHFGIKTPEMRRYLSNNSTYMALFDLCTDNDSGRAHLHTIQNLRQIMALAPAVSLDTLALENPEYRSHCKLLTASILANAISGQLKLDTTTNDWAILNNRIPQKNSNLGAQTSGLRHNWIHLFASMMRNSISKNSGTHFSFISFNYDCIVEKVLEKVWNISSRNIGNLADLANFYYPHGKLSWSEKHDKSVTFDISSYENSILFAHNKEHKDGFPAAIDALNDAERVISLGFHFAPENVLSLNLKKAAEEKPVIYQNFANNEELDRRVHELPFNDHKSFSGTIADGLLQGRLGELPS